MIYDRFIYRSLLEQLAANLLLLLLDRRRGRRHGQRALPLLYHASDG